MITPDTYYQVIPPTVTDEDAFVLAHGDVVRVVSTSELTVEVAPASKDLGEHLSSMGAELDITFRFDHASFRAGFKAVEPTAFTDLLCPYCGGSGEAYDPSGCVGNGRCPECHGSGVDVRCARPEAPAPT